MDITTATRTYIAFDLGFRHRDVSATFAPERVAAQYERDVAEGRAVSRYSYDEDEWVTGFFWLIPADTEPPVADVFAIILDVFDQRLCENAEDYYDPREVASRFEWATEPGETDWTDHAGRAIDRAYHQVATRLRRIAE